MAGVGELVEEINLGFLETTPVIDWNKVNALARQPRIEGLLGRRIPLKSANAIFYFDTPIVITVEKRPLEKRAVGLIAAHRGELSLEGTEPVSYEVHGKSRASADTYVLLPSLPTEVNVVGFRQPTNTQLAEAAEAYTNAVRRTDPHDVRVLFEDGTEFRTGDLGELCVSLKADSRIIVHCPAYARNPGKS